MIWTIQKNFRSTYSQRLCAPFGFNWPCGLTILLFPYKSICDQIWPWHQKGQGQPSVIIYIIYDGFGSPMLDTKCQGNRPTGSREVDIWRVFTIYRHGGHLDIGTILSNKSFISFLPWAFRWNLDSNGPVVSEKNKFEFWNLSELWPRSRNDLDLQYTCHRIYPLSWLHLPTLS